MWPGRATPLTWMLTHPVFGLIYVSGSTVNIWPEFTLLHHSMPHKRSEPTGVFYYEKWLKPLVFLTEAQFPAPWPKKVPTQNLQVMQCCYGWHGNWP